MEKKYLFNYDALNNYLNEQQKNPNWARGELDMFRDNCQKHLKKDGDKSSEYIITINDDTGDVSINGQSNLENEFQMIPTGYEMSNKARLYRQIDLSMQRAEKLGIFDQIFKEIREELDTLKETIGPNL